jgi:hypothetical protein
VQGYLFSKPVPRTEIPELIRRLTNLKSGPQIAPISARLPAA